MRHSPVGDLCHGAYDMYIATLKELYESEIVDNLPVSEDILKNLYAFQQRNTRLLITKLDKNKVAMLADSVGLGKTITAGAVMKYYIEKKATRVYVIAPARLTQQWTQDLADKHAMLGGFTVLSMQNMDTIEKAQELDKYKEVDLFVIDEAHNLRNENSSRYQRILEWLANNKTSKVLLLTATPVNNQLTDFVSQIQLASKGKRTSFPVVYETSKKTEVLDFWEVVGRLSTEITKAENKNEAPDWDRVRRVMRDGLKNFLVRSTREGIKREFGGLTDSHGVTRAFPEARVKPESYLFSSQVTTSVFECI